MTVDNPTLRRRQLGRLLKAARETSGKSREQVAAECNVSLSTVAQREQGNRGARINELRPHMDAVGVTDREERAALEELARQANQKGWWSARAGRLRATYLNFIGLEEGAQLVQEYEALVVPGLLQTEQYAKAFMVADHPELSEEEMHARWLVRQTRQDRTLARVQLHVVIDEACLRRVVGEQHVWQAQLKHLTEVSALRNVTLQVLPLSQGCPAGVTGGFTLLDLGDQRYCYLELADSDIWFEGEDAARYSMLHDRLRTLALPPGKPSLELIKQVANLGG